MLVGLDEHHVLRLEIAVDHIYFRRAECGKRMQNVTRKLTNEGEREALELGELEKIVQGEGKQLEDETLMIAKGKGIEHPHDIGVFYPL